MGRRVGGEFLPGAAAPGDGNGLEAGIGGSLHVHAGVSDVQDFLRTMYPGLPEDVPHYHRLRLAGHGDGDLDAAAADSGEELRYAVEGAGGVRAVFIVVGEEQAPDAQNFLLTAAGFRQGAFKEFVDAVADVGAISASLWTG